METPLCTHVQQSDSSLVVETPLCTHVQQSDSALVVETPLCTHVQQSNPKREKKIKIITYLDPTDEDFNAEAERDRLFILEALEKNWEENFNFSETFVPASNLKFKNKKIITADTPPTTKSVADTPPTNEPEKDADQMKDEQPEEEPLLD